MNIYWMMNEFLWIFNEWVHKEMNNEWMTMQPTEWWMNDKWLSTGWFNEWVHRGMNNEWMNDYATYCMMNECIVFCKLSLYSLYPHSS